MDLPFEPLSAAADAPGPTIGTLVLQTGRLQGVRRSLTVPLTLIGQSPNCEVRLQGAQIAPLHCAIVSSPDGLLLRDLGSLTGTFLNDEPALTRPLRHGDMVRVGLYEMRVELADEEPPIDRAALEAGRNALRVQTAAVAAQQAELAEAERRLGEQRTTLRRQHDQLAGHLDERRRQLQDMQAEVQTERKALEADREAIAQQRELAQAGLAQLRKEIVQEKDRVVQERQRLVELRRRLRQRWRRQWQHHEKALDQRQKELVSGQDLLQRQQANLQRERAGLVQAQLRFNGEVELGRRQLQEEWQRLAIRQQQWEISIRQEQEERQQRLRALERREADLALAEHALVERRQQGEQLQMRLRHELLGVEERIRNQREKLVEQEGQLAQRAALLQPPEAVCPRCATGAQNRSLVPADEQPQPSAGLLWLTGVLADQRRHLLEQWARLLTVQHAWQEERATLLAEVETHAKQLHQRQEHLAQQQQELAEREAELAQRQTSLAEVRCSLEAWQAGLAAREADAERERAVLLAQVQASQEQAQAQMARLEELHQQRARRWAEEIDLLRQARQKHEEMQGSYLTLWQQCQQEHRSLDQEQRQLTARALSLEQVRQQMLARSPDSSLCERRLQRLERRSQARLELQERELSREQHRLQVEIRRLHDQAEALNERERLHLEQMQKLARQQSAWEDQRASAAEVEERLRREVELLRLSQQEEERQRKQLREELERVAQLLLQGSELADPTIRAA